MLKDFLALEGVPSPQIVAQVDHIHASATRLIGMIDSLMADAMNDALDITLRREPVDLAALAREVSEANRPLADLKGQILRLDVPEEAYLCGDAERLREAIDNLVSNAVKYSLKGGTITVAVCHDAEEIVCTVSDHGPGLLPEDAARLFGRFQRLSAKPTGGEGSTGLGLSIVKRIAELHGGRTEAMSEGPGRGATFAIRFPNRAVALL
jgi:signal transduction histidine kinase